MCDNEREQEEIARHPTGRCWQVANDGDNPEDDYFVHVKDFGHAETKLVLAGDPESATEFQMAATVYCSTGAGQSITMGISLQALRDMLAYAEGWKDNVGEYDDRED